MSVICPTITAFDPHEYRAQIEQIEAFAKRIHIDLMDGDFAPSISPDLSSIWWPDNLLADIHLMYRQPEKQIEQLQKLKPNLVVVHYEADLNHTRFVEALHDSGIKAGIAILQETTIDEAIETINIYDHVLVFSGNLGYHGGELNQKLLGKVATIKQALPDIEIAWDGGINAENARQLVDGGVDVLNVGGFIQKSGDPLEAYMQIESSEK